MAYREEGGPFGRRLRGGVVRVAGLVLGVVSADAQQGRGPSAEPQEPSPVPGALEMETARALTFDGLYLQDWGRVLNGGRSEGPGQARYLGLTVGLDLEQALGWEDTSLSLDAFVTGGGGITTDLGDFQVASNIEAEPQEALAELWLETFLFERRLRLKVGKVDANNEYAQVRNGLDFVHSSPGFSPTIVGFPSFPDPAWSINASLHPSEDWALRVGLFDGALQEGISTGTGGVSTFLGAPADLFWIAQVDRRLGAGGEGVPPGRLGLGVWFHDGTFERFDGGTEDDARGAYLVLDHSVRWGADTVGLFLQAGTASGEVSPVDLHLGCGAVAPGPLPGDEDRVGLGFSWVSFSDAAGAGFTEPYELATEAFWRLRPLPWLTLQPGFQHVVHPGGEATLGNALLALLRLQVDWL